MILKMHAFFRDLPQLRQRKNLITAAIGQNWSIPIHKPMQPAEVFNHIEPRPNEQVIRISENDLRIQLAQLPGTDCFH